MRFYLCLLFVCLVFQYSLNLGVSSLLLFVQSQERQESDIQSCHEAKHSKLKAEVVDLEEKVASGNGSESISNGFDKFLHNCLEELNAAKRVQFYNFIATLVILLYRISNQVLFYSIRIAYFIWLSHFQFSITV